MIALLCWLLIPIVNAFIDAWIIEWLKQPIDHLIEAIFRGRPIYYLLKLISAAGAVLAGAYLV